MLLGSGERREETLRQHRHRKKSDDQQPHPAGKPALTAFLGGLGFGQGCLTTPADFFVIWVPSFAI